MSSIKLTGRTSAVGLAHGNKQDPGFALPREVRALIAARNALRDHYGHDGLRFTLDGNLVGDLGEALAVQLFGLELGSRCGAGIDGMIAGRTVQVKATGTNRGPAFRFVETRAEQLLFFRLDCDACRGFVEFNGPEEVARRRLPDKWDGQRSLTLNQIRLANAEVLGADRLPMRPC